jgi:glucose-6-phosphate isomerase
MVTNNIHFKGVDPEFIGAYVTRLNAEIKSGEIGYYHLPDLGLPIIEEALAYREAHKNLTDVVVIGIGGSSLGPKAVATMLKQHKQENTPTLHFMENVDPWSIKEILDGVDFKSTLFLIVSKSGNTIETISLTKLVMSETKCFPTDECFKEKFAVITDENSPLDAFAKEHSIKAFYIPKNVGGRFSVLSAVGLVPLSICGYDTKSLLEGADGAKKQFIDDGDEAIMQKAYRYAIHKQASINVIFSYADVFKEFNAWYTQLWAESLGKKHGYARMGLTPVGLVGSVDQHSFLQLIMEGPKDKTVTFIKIKSYENSMPIPDIHLQHLEKADYSTGLAVGGLLNAQCDATMKSVIQEGITTDILEVDDMDAWHVGFLMYYYELLTSTCGIMLGINTYDQPGVEVGKRILRKVLGSK